CVKHPVSLTPAGPTHSLSARQTATGRNIMNKSARSLAVAAMLSLLATASAQALTVYSSVDEENAKKILAAFTEATGVQVDMVFLSSGPALSRIEAEASRPQAD